MGNETELNLFEEPEPADNTTTGSDKKDDLEPLKEIQDTPVELAAENESESANVKSEKKMEIIPDSIDEQADNDLDLADPLDDISKEDADSAELDLNLDDIVVDEGLPLENQSEKDPQAATADESEDDDFLGLNDDDLFEQKSDDATPKELKSKEQPSADGKPEKSGKNKKVTKTSTKSPKETTTPGRRKLLLKVSGLALFSVVVAGIIVYTKPIFLKTKSETVTTQTRENVATEPVQTQAVQQQVAAMKVSSKRDTYASKLDEAGRLRDELLAKKDEIYKLKIHLQNGIAELEDATRREMQKAEITSFAQAMQNKRVELNLRSIQRRRNYIRELEKPAHWTHRGSEELLYLKRKAELDLDVIDMAEHIDMDRHMRHIGAAIQKYRPSAEKLAVHPQNTDLPSLEKIWSRIGNNELSSEQVPPEATDKEIVDEICSGYFHRTSKLTSFSDRAAKCLAKMKGSDLFLNGLTELSPSEAKLLFQWSGSWICLNGIKELSPEAAQYLFKWNGNWISLNGLTEFPPELARYLMKWKGKQLELMGLKYDAKNADKNGLKYLALWETMGGKLYISDDVREKMKRLTM
jgi:hypothetical protein